MIGMVTKKWWMATLSSGAIILSFVLLIGVKPATLQKARAAVSSPNQVVVSDYSPGKIVTVAKVKLESNGYVVVHEDSKGSPGAILGYSKLISEGDSMDVVVGLTREVRSGEQVYAMLHLDDGDGRFDPKTDLPAKDYLGNPVWISFVVGSEVQGTGVSY